MLHALTRVLIAGACVAITGAILSAGAQTQAPVTEPNPTDKLQGDVCMSKTGDAREACLKEGQDRQITSGVRGDVRAESTNSEYNVARAKCEAFSGSARDKCIADAKAKYKIID
ncbi:MAG TPA: hypothetical protein VIH50_04505 [Steroidobacteraceae bacterium]|jgi:hypothetical protein